MIGGATLMVANNYLPINPPRCQFHLQGDNVCVCVCVGACARNTPTTLPAPLGPKKYAKLSKGVQEGQVDESAAQSWTHRCGHTVGMRQ